MNKKILSNLLSSAVEKIFVVGIQFLTTMILIRHIHREDYGIIGIVAGYFAFINVINISLESILIRDHLKYENNLGFILNQFHIFNLFKSFIILFISGILCLFLYYYYDNSGFIFSIISITILTITDSIVAPFVILFASKFQQKLVTKINIARYTVHFLLTLGVFIFPYLWFIAIKDFFISLIYIFTWFLIASKHYSIKYNFKTVDINYLKNALFGYSLWTHINGVATNFIYKSDVLFLSFFTNLTMVGNYNIALNSANIANIAPMLLSYQNSIALSNSKSQEEINRTMRYFTKLSFLTGVITLSSFVFFGNYLTIILTGKSDQNIYNYMICIVFGLVLVKTFASPLISYINIFGSVKRSVSRITIPMILVTVLSYIIGSYFFQAIGAAVANIVIAIIWLTLVFWETKQQKKIANNVGI